MIVEGKFDKNGINYDRRMEPSDWRYSAAIVGMIRFFKDMDIDYHLEGRYLYYNFSDIYPEGASKDFSKDKNYLLFAENWFIDKMHHRDVERRIRVAKITDEDISEVNKKLTANTVMKEIFKGIKFDYNNKDKITKLISDNREELISRTFRDSSYGYKKYINRSKFRNNKDKVSRLLGFYVDTGKKTKSLGFCFDKDAKSSNDEVEFDFVPFGFSKGSDSIFINNNTSIKYLINSNDELENYLKNKLEKRSSWNTVFYNYNQGVEFVDYDVEIILKKINTENYETIYIRKSAIDIFRELSNIYKGENTITSLDVILNRFVKIGEENYINIMDEVTKSILNELFLDDLIERLMKEDYNSSSENYNNFLIGHLIKINEVIYKNFNKQEGKMENKVNLKASSASAFDVLNYFKKNKQENKINNYRQRLANTLVAKDYNRFIEIMLQLSSYTEIAFPFMHYLIDDFEGNKNLAYDFVNSLIDTNKDKKIESKNK